MVQHVSLKVSKGAKIMNRYNQVPHLTQDTNGKVTNSQLDTTNVSPIPAGDQELPQSQSIDQLTVPQERDRE